VQATVYVRPAGQCVRCRQLCMSGLLDSVYGAGNCVCQVCWTVCTVQATVYVRPAGPCVRCRQLFMSGLLDSVYGAGNCSTIWSACRLREIEAQVTVHRDKFLQ